MKPYLIPIALSLACLCACDKRESTTAVAPHSVSTERLTPSSSPGSLLDVRLRESEPFIKGFWYDAAPDYRWTISHHVEMAIIGSDPGPTQLLIATGCYIVPGKLDKQRILISLNGTTLPQLECSEGGVKPFSVPVPPNVLKGRNQLVFDLPDANSPQAFGQGTDNRVLGLAFQSAEIKKTA